MQAERTEPGESTANLEKTSAAEAQAPEKEPSANQAAEELAAARQRLAKVGRNDSCPCGSGRKYKKCCLPKDEALALQAGEAERKAAAERALQSPLAPAWPSPAAIPEEAESEPLRLFDTHTEPADDLPPEIDEKLEQMWDDFEKLEHPSTAEMDALLDKLLALPPQATVWNEVLHTFAAKEHADLPGVFRRIISVVPHSRETRLSYLYWAAAEEFSRRGWRELLPEVAAGLHRFDAQSYDADVLWHVEFFLLADGFDAEVLALDEYFLPIKRQDEELLPYAVTNTAEEILQLRLGRLLQEDLGPEPLLDGIVQRLCGGLEKDEFNFEAVRFLAAVAAGQALTEPLKREDFELRTEQKPKPESPPEETFRLGGALLRVAQEAGRAGNVPPGCGYVALLLVTESVPTRKAPGKQAKKPTRNLLDYLRPADLEARLVRSCQDLLSIDVPKARLMLQGYELLLHFARNHQLIPAAQADSTEKTLIRLKGELQRL